LVSRIGGEEFPPAASVAGLEAILPATFFVLTGCDGGLIEGFQALKLA
jgi:hypothetical protein